MGVKNITKILNKASEETLKEIYNTVSTQGDIVVKEVKSEIMGEISVTECTVEIDGMAGYGVSSKNTEKAMCMATINAILNSDNEKWELTKQYIKSTLKREHEKQRYEIIEKYSLVNEGC